MNQLTSESNYHTPKYFSQNLMAMEMNKLIYLGMSILDISKTVCDFWYDYIKPKYQGKAKLCYMDSDSYFCQN